MHHILKWLLIIRVKKNKADSALYAPTPLMIHFTVVSSSSAGIWISSRPVFTYSSRNKHQLHIWPNRVNLTFSETHHYLQYSSLLRRNPLTWDKHVGILLPRSSGSRMTFLRGWAQRKAAAVQTVWSAAAPQDAFQRENVTHRCFLNYNEVGSGKRARLEDD